MKKNKPYHLVAIATWLLFGLKFFEKNVNLYLNKEILLSGLKNVKIFEEILLQETENIRTHRRPNARTLTRDQHQILH